jgi:hypothetical protein
MLADAKELYTSVETYASILIKEDLAMHTRASDQRQRVAEELEAKLREREGLDDLKLEHGLESLASRESTLASREASLWRSGRTWRMPASRSFPVSSLLRCMRPA